MDQLEQILFGHDRKHAEDLLAHISQLAYRVGGGHRIVLSLREDYLGHHRRLLEHGFRVEPMTVREMADAVCKIVEIGVPALFQDRGGLEFWPRSIESLKSELDASTTICLEPKWLRSMDNIAAKNVYAKCEAKYKRLSEK